MKDRINISSIAFLFVFTWQLTIMFTSGFSQYHVKSFNFSEPNFSFVHNIQSVDAGEIIDLSTGIFGEEVLEEEALHNSGRIVLSVGYFIEEVYSHYLLNNYLIQLSTHLVPPELTV